MVMGASAVRETKSLSPCLMSFERRVDCIWRKGEKEGKTRRREKEKRKWGEERERIKERSEK